MEQLSPYWMEFHEISYFRILRKPAEKIQVSLKSDKNNDYTPMYVYDISLNSLNHMSETNVVEKLETHILNLIFFFENRAVYYIMWKNMVAPDRSLMTEYGAEKTRFACWITKARTQTHT
jgi:hypothetical protein